MDYIGSPYLWDRSRPLGPREIGLNGRFYQQRAVAQVRDSLDITTIGVGSAPAVFRV